MNYEEERAMFETKIANIDESISAWLAIQDVLAIPKWSNYMDDTPTEIRETTAYNRALEDVYQAITNRLGGGHEPNQVTKDAIEEARKMK